MESNREDFRMLLAGLINYLTEVSRNTEYNGDLADLGNEVGVAIGGLMKNMSGEEMRTFVMGFNHGVSLTNGTHG